MEAVFWPGMLVLEGLHTILFVTWSFVCACGLCPVQVSLGSVVAWPMWGVQYSHWRAPTLLFNSLISNSVLSLSLVFPTAAWEEQRWVVVPCYQGEVLSCGVWGDSRRTNDEKQRKIQTVKLKCFGSSRSLLTTCLATRGQICRCI